MIEIVKRLQRVRERKTEHWIPVRETLKKFKRFFRLMEQRVNRLLCGSLDKDVKIS